ncbi:MAG: putative lipoprotein [Frankiales bacterium]|nr:putative lipoprotein [Frankiales bacterium]
MTLTDDLLTRALADAAEGFPDSAWDGVPEDRAGESWWRGKAARVTGIAAASVAVLVLAGTLASHVDSGARSSDTASVKGNGGADSPAGTTGGAGLQFASGQPVAAPVPLGAHLSGTQVERTPGDVAPAGEPAATSGDSTRIVQTGSIALVVDDGKVSVTMDRLAAIARAVRGSVASSQLQSAGDNPSALVTLRVPVASFDAVVKQITGKGLGAKVINSDTAGKDVTAEYADTTAQIASLRAARDRYLTILNAAKSVGEILSVQQRVDSVQGQIDRLEGSRRLLANQSDLATLEVSVNQKTTQVLVSAERSGWSKAWHDAGHGFTGGIQALVAHSGRALLVLLVAAACLLVARGGWRVARRRLL